MKLKSLFTHSKILKIIIRHTLITTTGTTGPSCYILGSSEMVKVTESGFDKKIRMNRMINQHLPQLNYLHTILIRYLNGESDPHQALKDLTESLSRRRRQMLTLTISSIFTGKKRLKEQPSDDHDTHDDLSVSIISLILNHVRHERQWNS